MRGNFIPPLYQGPLSWLPRGWDHGDQDFLALLLAAEDIVYLVIAYPFDALHAARGMGWPLLRKPLGWSPYFHYRGGTVPVRLGDHHGYISHGTDIPPSHPFPAVLETAYSIEVGLGGGEQDRLGGGQVSFGSMAIKNGTGEQDALTNYSWGGRVVEIKAGLEDWPLSQFATVLRGNIANILAADDGINLGIASRDGVIDNPLTRNYFDGSGGAGGPAELAQVPIPLALGRCHNIPLVQITADIWKAAEQLAAVITVRNRGLAVDDSGNDYSSYALLAAASVTPGEYATCLAEGLIKFGSPVDLPTADVDGPTAWGTTPATITSYLLRNRLGRFNLTAADIDGGSFNRAEAERGWRCGIYIDAETTMRPVTRRLMQSIGGWLLPNRRGLFQIGLYARPTTTVGTVSAADVDDAGPSLVGRWRAVRKLTLGYKPMWRVLTGADMSEAVSAADRNLLGRAWRSVEEQRSVADRDAVDYQHSTDLDEQADAEELAGILADLLSWATHLWSVPLRELPLRYWAGDRRSFAYPRHGLDNGRPFLVRHVTESDSGDSALLLWGGRP